MASSMLSRRTKVSTYTGLVWPIRCARLTAWASICGEKTGLTKKTREAELMSRPYAACERSFGKLVFVK